MSWRSMDQSKDAQYVHRRQDLYYGRDGLDGPSHPITSHPIPSHPITSHPITTATSECGRAPSQGRVGKGRVGKGFHSRVFQKQNTKLEFVDDSASSLLYQMPKNPNHPEQMCICICICIFAFFFRFFNCADCDEKRYFIYSPTAISINEYYNHSLSSKLVSRVARNRMRI